MPYSFSPGRPLSAQDLIRTTLKTAAGADCVLVSFHPDGSSPSPAILKVPARESVRGILSVSKSDEFEAFAEDDFICQRCGRKAPEVLLCLGEVKQFAVSDRDYVTICIDCDQAIRPQGFSIRETISSEEESELRKQQLDFMANFQSLSDSWSVLVPDYSLSEKEKCLLCELILQFGADEILTGMRKAAYSYVESIDGAPTDQSVSFAFRRVGGICHNTRLQKITP
jgi:hypothetical protein